MLSTISVTPLALEIKPSRRLACYVLSVYLVATLVVIILPLSPWFVSAALGAVLLSGAVTYHNRVSLHRPDAVVGLNRHVDGTWQMRHTDGTSHLASLLPDSYLHPELLLLNFRLSTGKRRSVVLLSDSADATSLRRLRVGLMLGVRNPLE